MLVFILGGIPDLLLEVQMLLSSCCVRSEPAKKAVELITVMRLWCSLIPRNCGVTNSHHRHLVQHSPQEALTPDFSVAKSP